MMLRPLSYNLVDNRSRLDFSNYLSRYMYYSHRALVVLRMDINFSSNQALVILFLRGFKRSSIDSY